MKFRVQSEDNHLSWGAGLRLGGVHPKERRVFIERELAEVRH